MASNLEIFDRYQRAQSQRGQWWSLMQDAYYFFYPERNIHGDQSNEYYGGTEKAKPYTGVMIEAGQSFANRVQAALFPEDERFCHLTCGEEIPYEYRGQIQKALDGVTLMMFDVMNRANVGVALGEMLPDLAIGTGTMLVQRGDGDSIVKYDAVPSYYCMPEEGKLGKVEYVFRPRTMRIEQIQMTWPLAIITPSIKEKMKGQKGASEQIELVEAVIKNDIASKKKYTYMVFYAGGGGAAGMEILYEEPRKENPFIVGRYSKLPGEVHGRGPCYVALPFARALNHLARRGLQAADLSILPPLLAVDDGVLNPNNIRYQAAAVIPASSRDSLTPLITNMAMQTGQITMQEMAQSIKRIMLDRGLPPDNMSARTATEIMERMKEMADDMGSAFGRIQSEIVTPLVTKTLDAMQSARMIDLRGLKVDGKQIKITATSPLAMAQGMKDVQNLLRYQQVAMSFGPMGQVAVNPDRAIDFIGDRMGVDRNLRLDEQERRAIMQQMAQTAAEAAPMMENVSQNAAG